MKRNKSGKRYPLLVYRRAMSRLGTATLVLGVVLIAVWGWEMFRGSSLVTSGSDIWLVAGATIALAFSAFAFIARLAAYVQVYKDHLRFVTPFLRLKISYRRVRSVYPASLAQLYPPKDLGWALHRFLEPFYGMTAVVVELNGFPMSPALLRLFLPPVMFLKREQGLVLLVPDWMSFSTELDSFQGNWLEFQSRRGPGGAVRRTYP